MNRYLSEQAVNEIHVSESTGLLPPLLVVGEQKRSGLILCKSYSAEFSGPGAAICSPFGQTYSMIIAIGSPEIIEVTTHEERQKAYSRRIQWVRWLNKIVSHPDAIQRTDKLFAGFEEFFGSEILAAIPDEVMASLSGVLPQTVAYVRSQYPRFCTKEDAVKENELDLKILVSDQQTCLLSTSRMAFVDTKLTNTLTNFPFSA